MHVFNAPSNEVDQDYPRPWIFLAGGITNCPDWQSELIAHPEIVKREGTLLNPRQPSFDTKNKMASVMQIGWEHTSLTSADCIIFWFARGSMNPIALFEYGMWLGRKSGLAGCDPEYPHLQTVITQTALYCREMPIYLTWEDFLIATCGLIDAWHEDAKEFEHACQCDECSCDFDATPKNNAQA